MNKEGKRKYEQRESLPNYCNECHIIEANFELRKKINILQKDIYLLRDEYLKLKNETIRKTN